MYLLLDENVPPKVSRGLRKRRPDIAVVSVHDWEDGICLGIEDIILLRTAIRHGMVLVSYDQKTIPRFLRELALGAEVHAGVLYIDDKTIHQNDIGGLMRALEHFWDAENAIDWTGRVDFIKKKD